MRLRQALKVLGNWLDHGKQYRKSTLHAAERRIGEDPAHLYGEPICLIGPGGIWRDTDQEPTVK